MTLRVFIGYDHRQPISLNVLANSIYRNSSKPVAITPIVLEQVPYKRTGLTPFTFSRFLVPYLCNYEGWGLFLDLDMLVTGDIAELFAMADDRYKVMVHKSRLQFEWASVMLFNCAKNKEMTPEFLEKADKLHHISWCKPDEIGDIPAEWNHLVGYDKKPEKTPKLIHYTQGIPAFPETKNCDYADLWEAEHGAMNGTIPWVYLMGNSVHAVIKDGQPVPRFTVEPPQ